MPTSPLPNWAVSPVASPLWEAAVVAVVPLSSPHAARKAARAVEPPVSAMNFRRETGSPARRAIVLSGMSSLLGSFALPPSPTRTAGRADHSWQRTARPEKRFGRWIARAEERLGRRAGADPLARRRDPRDPLADPLGRDAGEGEPQAALASLDHEVRAGDEGDALGLCLGQQGARVGLRLEVEPEEVAAARDDELGLRELLAERLDQRVAAFAQSALDELDIAVEPPRPAELEDHRLGQHVGRYVGLVGAL